MSVLDDVIADLSAEGDQLRTTVAALDADAWRTPTPAEGWDVATTIAHLLWTDEVAVLAAGALTDEGKQAWDAVVLLALEDPTGFVDKEAQDVGEAEASGETWQVWRDDTDTALVREAGGVTTLVVGSVDQAALEDYVELLS